MWKWSVKKMVTQYWMPETMKKMEVRQSSTYTYTLERQSTRHIAPTERWRSGARAGASERGRDGLASGSASASSSSMASGTVPKARPSGTSSAPCSKKGSRQPATSECSVSTKEVRRPPTK